jgi:hypothetical protein
MNFEPNMVLYNTIIFSFFLDSLCKDITVTETLILLSEMMSKRLE